MDKKILMQDLADGLMQRKGLSKKEAENFVRSVFEMIGEFLQTDKIVKIKGLGTFKLVTVDSRESVDVNTGERILIREYTKINFTPDPVLRDTVNKPFAQFETVVLYEGTDIADMERMDEKELAEKAGVDSLPDNGVDRVEDTEQAPADKEETEEVSPAVPEETDEKEGSAYEGPEEDDRVSMETAGIEETDAEEAEENVKEVPSDDAVRDEESHPVPVEIPSGEQPEEAEMEKVEPETVAEAVPVPEAGDVERMEQPQEEEKEKDTSVEETIRKDEAGTEARSTVSDRSYHSSGEGPRQVETMHVSTQQIEVQKVEHQTVENQHIVHVAPESHRRRVYLTPWMMFFCILLVLLLMAISYYIGYHHLLYSERENPARQVPDTALLPGKGLPADSVGEERSDTLREEKPDTAVQKSPAASALPPAGKPSPAQPVSQPDTLHPEKYQQVKGGAYEIVGIQERHRLRSGETLRGLALKYYGSKDFTVYLVVQNKIKNPDLVPEGMWLEIPQLRLKRR